MRHVCKYGISIIDPTSGLSVPLLTASFQPLRIVKGLQRKINYDISAIEYYDPWLLTRSERASASTLVEPHSFRMPKWTV